MTRVLLPKPAPLVDGRRTTPILPGLAAAEELTQNGMLAALIVVAGLLLGAVLMLGLDQFTPHEHAHGGPCGPGCERQPVLGHAGPHVERRVAREGAHGAGAGAP